MPTTQYQLLTSIKSTKSFHGGTSYISFPAYLVGLPLPLEHSLKFLNQSLRCLDKIFILFSSYINDCCPQNYTFEECAENVTQIAPTWGSTSRGRNLYLDLLGFCLEFHYHDCAAHP